jgi:alginate O-acetyltransferase complex protein AlgI
MLFNSFVFLFGFLPLALIVTYGLGRWKRNWAALALTLLSLGFYAWWKPAHLPLLLGSIVFNYWVGDVIQKARAEGRSRAVSLWLTAGLVGDLSLLGWFKYANFVTDNLNLAFGAHLHLAHIGLPLAISFFTFQKIAYLIDSARGEAKRIGFLEFALFASFFPQLIAGPIVHYKEIVPQLNNRLFGRLIWRNILVGLVIFAIGLFKKTVIADTLSSYANPLFGSFETGHTPGLLEAWTAAASFTFQLYFDFSGYSDMAIGLGRMFGVKLPLNFHSPLRAASIIEYWRRWHMTLQRFIVAYIFQPLSLPLNRWAAMQGIDGWNAFFVTIGIPTFVTFVAVGIWHGAGWTFVIFGVLHALYMCINEAWRVHKKNLRKARRKAKLAARDPGLAERLGYHAVTLIAVAFGNVMFRSTDFSDAMIAWQGMAGVNGMDVRGGSQLLSAGLIAAMLVSVLLVFFTPNTQQIMRRFDPAYNWADWKNVAPAAFAWTWKPNATGLAFAGTALFLGIMFIQRGQAIFLYFNF